MTISRALIVLCATALALVTHTAPASAIERQTLQIGTNGSASGPTMITYTCGAVCGPQLAPQGRWTMTVTVPVGSQVWIQAQNFRPDPSGRTPDCWISEQPGGRMLVQKADGGCVFQAPPVAPPDAPPSS